MPLCFCQRKDWAEVGTGNGNGDSCRERNMRYCRVLKQTDFPIYFKADVLTTELEPFSIKFPHPSCFLFPLSICSWLYEPAWPASAFTHPDHLLWDLSTPRWGIAEGQCWTGHMWWGTVESFPNVLFASRQKWFCFLEREGQEETRFSCGQHPFLCLRCSE